MNNIEPINNVYILMSTPALSCIFGGDFIGGDFNATQEPANRPNGLGGQDPGSIDF